jgi:hypothetical protein
MLITSSQRDPLSFWPGPFEEKQMAKMGEKYRKIWKMGLDLLPILPRALPPASAVAVVGRSAQPQQHCQNGRIYSSYMGL